MRIVGRSVEMIRPGKREMTFRPAIPAHGSGRLLRGRGRLGVPGIFDGDHELRIEPTDEGTRFTQREKFSGVLVPLMRRVLDDTDAALRAVNEAAESRAETLHRPAESEER